MKITAESMAVVARETLEKTHNSAKEEDKMFRRFFGAPIAIVADIWNRLDGNIEKSSKPKHLLWALVFLKVYSTEDVHCRIVGWPDPKTFWKWSWYFIEKMADLASDVIKLENRFKGWKGDTTCLMSVDGTDCPVYEPWPFDPKWFSKKFNGPGVKYEQKKIDYTKLLCHWNNIYRWKSSYIFR